MFTQRKTQISPGSLISLHWMLFGQLKIQDFFLIMDSKDSDQTAFMCKVLRVLIGHTCPKILYTKVSRKMEQANSTDPDQIAPEGTV